MLGKLQYLQGLRALAVCMVLFSHLLMIEKKYSPEAILPEISRVGVAGVDLFFVISGFIMYMISSGEKVGWRLALNFLYRRALRIYPVYWFYTSLVLAVYVLVPGLVNSGQQSSIVYSYLLWPTEMPFLVGVGWTLVYELYFYFVFALLFYFLRPYFLSAVMVWGWIVFVLSFLSEDWAPWLRYATSPMVFEFIFGVFLAYLVSQGRLKLSPTACLGLAIVALVAMTAFAGVSLSVTGDTPNGWWRVAAFGMPSVLLVLAAYSADREGYTLPRWLVLMGDSSYSTYLSHVLVLSVLGYAWVWVGGFLAISSVFMLPLMVVACVIYGWLSYRFIEKPLLEIGRRAVRF